jgi:hypothetical protein
MRYTPAAAQVSGPSKKELIHHYKTVYGSADKFDINILFRDLKSNTYFRNINTEDK